MALQSWLQLNVADRHDMSPMHVSQASAFAFTVASFSAFVRQRSRHAPTS